MAKNRDIASSWQEFLEARRREGKPLRKLQYAENDISKAWADLYADDEVAPPDPVEAWIEAEAEFDRAKKQLNTAYDELHSTLDILLRNDDKGLKPDEKDWTFDKDIEEGYLLIETWPEVRKSPGRQRDIVKQQLTAFDRDKLKAELAAKGVTITTTRTKKDEPSVPPIPHKKKGQSQADFQAEEKAWYDKMVILDNLLPPLPELTKEHEEYYLKLVDRYSVKAAS